MGIAEGRISLAIAATDTQTVYAAVSGSGQGGTSLGRLVAILKSTDGGATWGALPNPPDLGSSGWYGLPLAVDPASANTVYLSAGGAPIVESRDGGFTWFSLQTGADGLGPHPDHHAFAFDASGNLLDGNDGGIWRLADPAPGRVHWTDLNNNLELTQYIGIALDPSTPNVAYGGSQDNGTSKFNDALGWTLEAAGDGGFVRVDPSHPQTVYHEFTGVSIERSDNGGLSWISKTFGINASDPRDTYVPYVMDPSNSSRLLLGTNRVYETTDRADHWHPISTPGQNGWTVTSNIDSIVAGSDGHTVYASAGGHVFVTFDDGATWQRRDIPGVSDHLQDLEIDPHDNLTAYAVRDRFGGGHLFRTTDGGLTWFDLSSGLPDLPAYTLAIDPRTGGLYVGNDDGVYVSADQGGSWSRFGQGLPHAQVRELELNAHLQVLAAGTHGRGLWEILVLDPLSTGSGTSGLPQVPTVTSVRLNEGQGESPGAPVNSITIHFSGEVTLTAGAFAVNRQDDGSPSGLNVFTFEVAGNTVAVLTFTDNNLVDGGLPDGAYTLTIQGDLIQTSLGQVLGQDFAGDRAADFFAADAGDQPDLVDLFHPAG
jgi:photosystem II stability/assembly factor-like uncharacterized protein